MNEPMIRQDDALANLMVQTEMLPEPYLITGPQAAYLYHHWLQPIIKMIDISIPSENKPLWQDRFPAPWVVLSQTPTLNQARQAARLMVLNPLSKEQYARRVIHWGTTFISPEDLCLDLLSTAKTQIGLTEIAALLIRQRDNLDWSYLFAQTQSAGLSYRLAQIISLINHEAGRSVIHLPQVTAPHGKTITAIEPNSVRELLPLLRLQTICQI